MDSREFTERSLSCANRLYRISYLILRNDADCEDAVQETLLRAWLHIGSLRETAYFETWLIRILVNESKRILRRRPGPQIDIGSAPAIAAKPPDPGLRDAIRSLDLKYRVPVILHHLEGYELREIAKMLGLPVSTIKWRLHNGRKLLKQLLLQEEEML